MKHNNMDFVCHNRFLFSYRRPQLFCITLILVLNQQYLFTFASSDEINHVMTCFALLLALLYI